MSSDKQKASFRKYLGALRTKLFWRHKATLRSAYVERCQEVSEFLNAEKKEQVDFLDRCKP